MTWSSGRVRVSKAGCRVKVDLEFSKADCRVMVDLEFRSG